MGKFKEIDILQGDLSYYPEAKQVQRMEDWGLDEDTRSRIAEYRRQLAEQALLPLPESASVPE